MSKNAQWSRRASNVTDALLTVCLYIGHRTQICTVLAAFKCESILVELQQDLQENVIVGECYKRGRSKMAINQNSHDQNGHKWKWPQTKTAKSQTKTAILLLDLTFLLCELCQPGISCHRVSVCLPVCLSPVSYTHLTLPTILRV